MLETGTWCFYKWAVTARKELSAGPENNQSVFSVKGRLCYLNGLGPNRVTDFY